MTCQEKFDLMRGEARQTTLVKDNLEGDVQSWQTPAKRSLCLSTKKNKRRESPQ